MKTLVIRVDPERRTWWKETMQNLLPFLKIVLWDEDDFDPEEVEYVVTWNPPIGLFDDLVNLKCVVSVGAEVANIVAASMDTKPAVGIGRRLHSIAIARVNGRLLFIFRNIFGTSEPFEAPHRLLRPKIRYRTFFSRSPT